MRYFTMSTLAAALLLVPGPSVRAQGDNAEQERAIARIEKLGGKVELDEQRPGKPVIKVDLRQTKVTDADLQILKAFTQVRSLNLGSDHTATHSARSGCFDFAGCEDRAVLVEGREIDLALCWPCRHVAGMGRSTGEVSHGTGLHAPAGSTHTGAR